jgi:hypothetical protein
MAHQRKQKKAKGKKILTLISIIFLFGARAVESKKFRKKVFVHM